MAPVMLNQLSPREAQLAELVADGMSNAEVGNHLGLSVRTVENHLRSIYDKLGVRKRTFLARLIAVRDARL